MNDENPISDPVISEKGQIYSLNGILRLLSELSVDKFESVDNPPRCCDEQIKLSGRVGGENKESKQEPVGIAGNIRSVCN